MNLKQIFVIAIIAMFLLVPFASAKQESVDVGNAKHDKKTDDTVVDKTKEQPMEVKNKDKDITGKITVTDSDTSEYDISKDGEHSLRIKKEESRGEHTKTKVTIDKSELDKLDKDNDKKFRYIRIGDNGEVLDNKIVTQSELQNGYQMTFSEVIVGGITGYNEYVYNNVVSGQTLDFPDVSGDYYITASVNGTIPENNLTKYIIGYEWNTSSSSPTLRTIDVNGNTFNQPAGYFDVHPIFGNVWRCVINPATNTVTYGTNPRGDGLDLTGASGQVMVSYPKGYVKYEEVGSLKRWWTSPYPYTGFELDPAYVQRGGDECDVIFQGAYEASGYMDGSTFKLISATNKQPITGAVNYTNLPNSGRLYITDAEAHANNISSNDWGITNIYTLSTMRRLMYTEMGTLNSQAKLGSGVVYLSSGTGFAGRFTGANSTDSNINVNGTWTGAGTDGLRPIAYRGLENPYGNVYKWVGGIRFYDTAHQIIPPNGTSYPSQVTTTGKYIRSTSIPPNTGIASNGYISNVFTDTQLKYMMLGSTLTGSDSTYSCDLYTIRPSGATPTCLMFGGMWNTARAAGIGSLSTNVGPSTSARYYGARIEYINPIYDIAPATDNGDAAIYIGTNGHYTPYNVSSGAEKIIETDATCTNLRYVNAMDNNPHTINVKVYFTEDITKTTETKGAVYQNVSIIHTKQNATASVGSIAWELDPLYSGTPILTSNNTNATVSRNDTHVLISTGLVKQGQSFSYAVSVPDNHDHIIFLNKLMKWMGSGWDYVGVAPEDWTDAITDIEVTVS